jgi:hypothetical protein
MRKFVTCALLLFLLGQAAYAAEFHCPSGDSACLIAAIRAANANGQENSIFLAGGEYRLAAVDNTVIDSPDGFGGFITEGPNGLPTIRGRLTIRGPEGIGSTLVRDENAPDFRFFYVESTGNLTLSWIHITGGHLLERISGGPPLGGGAIRSHGTLNLSNTILYGNEARGPGGAVSSGRLAAGIDGSTLTIQHSTIRNNVSGPDENASGGGIDSRGSALIEDTFIHGNVVRGDFGGGGISSNGELLLRRTTIARNRVLGWFGGGGIFALGTTWIEDSSIYENESAFAVTAGGGGIENFGAMTIVSSTVSNNRSETVGGIRNARGATLKLRNAGVTQNLALGTIFRVGGIATDGSGSVSLENSVVAQNSFSSLSSGPYQPSDCGIDGSGMRATEPQFTSYGFNIIGSLAACDAVLQTTDFLGDPSFGPFLHDARPGRAHFPLLPGSPAIDRGNPAVCRPTDQVGRVRLGPCDIGAVEFRSISLAGANSFITLVPLEETFRFVGPLAPGFSSENRCPPGFAGVFLFTARLANQSGRDLRNLVLQVAELNSGNLLQGAHGTTFGAGSLLSLSFNTRFNWTEPLDGTLRPTEFVDVPFSVCLRDHAPFQFSVNVYEVSEPEE